MNIASPERCYRLALLANAFDPLQSSSIHSHVPNSVLPVPVSGVGRAQLFAMGTNLQKAYCCPCTEDDDILAQEDTGSKTLKVKGKVSEKSVAMSIPGLMQELARIENLSRLHAAKEYVKLAWIVRRSTYTNPLELKRTCAGFGGSRLRGVPGSSST